MAYRYRNVKAKLSDDDFQPPDRDTEVPGFARRCLSISCLILSWLAVCLGLGYTLLSIWGLAGPSLPPSLARNPTSYEEDRFSLHPELHSNRAPHTIAHEWILTKGIEYPDGVRKEVYLVNGLFPGPTIECRTGDTLVITVHNRLFSTSSGNGTSADDREEDGEGSSIHWHGLRLFGQNSMDGAVGLTQCPIPAGKSWTYKIRVENDQVGTYWWHAHSQVQRADGLYGSLIIHPPSPSSSTQNEPSLDPHFGTYDHDLLILLTDWYHRPATEAMGWYMSRMSTGFEPVPDSGLINGKGVFNCSKSIVPFGQGECRTRVGENGLGLWDRKLDPRKAYRVRLINAGSLTGFDVSIDDHPLQVIEADGSPVDPVKVSSVHIGPGQRYSFIFRPRSDLSSGKGVSFRAVMDEECFNYPNPVLDDELKALIAIDDDVLSLDPPLEDDRQEETPALDPFMLSPHPLTYGQQERSLSPSAPVSRIETIYAKSTKLDVNGNVPWGFINRTSWRPSPVPLLIQSPSQADESKKGNQLVISIHREEWIELIVNNLDEASHPFHLHGHSFYVTNVHRSTIGWGSFNPSLSPHPEVQYTNAAPRDTVTVPRRGYVILRFKADNPGMWMFHCHVLWHLASGMGMSFEVRTDDVQKEQREVSALSCRL